LLIMAVASKFYYGANLLTRARVMLLQQDLRKGWVRHLVEKPAAGITGNNESNGDSA
jgi:hypothetical protein